MSLVNSNKDQPLIAGVQVQAIFNEISFSVGEAKTLVMLDESQVMKASLLDSSGSEIQPVLQISSIPKE